MSSEARDVLIVGLRNAHSVENQAIEILEKQAKALSDYPEVQAKIEQHLEETEGQKERLEEALEILGETTSTIKDAALSTLGNLTAMANTMADDAILKNSFASYSFEHYEIAAYESLLELAKLAGETEIVQLLNPSLEEERAMADWLGSGIRDVTRQYVQNQQRKAA